MPLPARFRPALHTDACREARRRRLGDPYDPTDITEDEAAATMRAFSMSPNQSASAFARSRTGHRRQRHRRRMRSAGSTR
jgi:hypothetical protein